MVPCWLCSKTFQNKTALNTHLSSKEHRRQTVICVWCPIEKTFTKPGDLANHCRQFHFKETKNLSKSFFSMSNCFYFAIFPQDYAAIASSVESWTSPDAIEARGLVLNFLQNQPGAVVKLELWQQGWKTAIKAKSNSKAKKENGEGTIVAVAENDQSPVEKVEASKEDQDIVTKDVKVDVEVESGKQREDKIEKDSSRETKNVERKCGSNKDDVTVKEQKQEIEIRAEGTSKSDKNKMMKSCENRNECASDIAAHKSKKHKHKSKRGHEDGDKKIKKLKTKKLKTDKELSETKENFDPIGNITTTSSVNFEKKQSMKLKESSFNLEKPMSTKKEEIHNETPTRCIGELESYIKDITFDPEKLNEISSGAETPLCDEKNHIEGELELVSYILGQEKTEENGKRSSTDETKTAKRVKIRYEDYVAKKVDVKHAKKVKGTRLDGEEKIVNEKGDSIGIIQGDDNIWRRVGKPVQNSIETERNNVKTKLEEEKVKSPKSEKALDSVSDQQEIADIIEADTLDIHAIATGTNEELNVEPDKLKPELQGMTLNEERTEIGVGNDESVEYTEPAECSDTQNEPDYATQAITILKRGVMPLCPPARRQWGLDTEEQIPIGGIVMVWPPRNWNSMTPDRRLLTTETMAMTMEAFFYGHVDAQMSRGFLLDKYNYLILPGSVRHHREKVEEAATKSRFYTYQLLKEVANGKNPSFAESQQIEMLELVMRNQVLPFDPSSMSVPLRLNTTEQSKI